MPVTELAIAGHTPGPHHARRGQRVAVRVGRRDLHDLAADPGDSSRPVELQLADRAPVPDHAKPVDTVVVGELGTGASRAHAVSTSAGDEGESPGTRAPPRCRCVASCMFEVSGEALQLSTGLQSANISPMTADSHFRIRRRRSRQCGPAVHVGLGPALRRAWLGYQIRLDTAMADAGFGERQISRWPGAPAVFGPIRIDDLGHRTRARHHPPRGQQGRRAPPRSWLRRGRRLGDQQEGKVSDPDRPRGRLPPGAAGGCSGDREGAGGHAW